MPVTIAAVTLTDGASPLIADVPRERPILFSGPMVRAIIEGRKTQTRRIVKPQPEHRGNGWTAPGTGDLLWADGSVLPHKAGACPYGGLGDRMWVRETHQIFTVGASTGVAYRATCAPDGSFNYVDGDEVISIKPASWRPSIHMRRAWSRITLEITTVLVERLQAITEEDAQAEGATPFFALHPGIGRDQRLTSGERCDDAEHRAGFACLWDAILGDRATWKSNPWVWVVEFKRVT